MEKVTLKELWNGRQRLIEDENEFYKTLEEREEQIRLSETEEDQEEWESILRREINAYITFVLSIHPYATTYKGGEWLCDTIGRKVCEKTKDYYIDKLTLRDDDGHSVSLVEVSSGAFTTNIFAINLASARNIARDVHKKFLEIIKIEEKY